MAVESVPWLVGGGAEHSAEVGRVLAYACADGGEGIIGAGSFKVVDRVTPDNQVNVFPGAAILHNNSLLPSTAYEAYVARASTSTLVPIAPTTSAGPRSDLVILRVEDPQYAPWAAPVNPAAGPYAFVRVIQGVPAGTRDIRDLDPSFAITYPAITLARVDVPASTATIQQSHIFDLRRIANPRLQDANRSYRTVAAQVYGTGGLAHTGAFQTWPTSWTQRIPSWATTCSLRSHYGSLYVAAGNFQVELRAKITFGATTVASAATGVDIDSSAYGNRYGLLVADELVLPAALRGKVATFSLEIRELYASVNAQFDAYSVIATDLLFSEVAE